MANPQTGGAQLVGQDGISLPVAGPLKPSGNINLSDRGFMTTLDATNGAFTVTLPVPSNCKGQPLLLKKIDSTANIITIAQNAAETIDGQTSIVLTKQYEVVMLVSDGTNWSMAIMPSEAFTSASFTQAATSGVTPSIILTVTGAANTTVTASTEAIDISLALARTVQWSTGALTLQRQVLITAPTLGFVGASTVTNAVLMEVNGIPIAGTNATITTSTALRVVGTSADVANTRIGLGVTGTFSDGAATSTTTAYGVAIQQTINYSAATKTGQYYGLYVNPTNTSLPTGPTAAIALSLTASTLGGIILNNQTDELTNPEQFFFKWASNVATIGTAKIGTGTVRSFAVSTGGTTALTINSSQQSTFATDVTITAGKASVTGAVGGTGALAVTGAVQTTGASGIVTVTGAASTGQTASTEISLVNFNLAQTVTWATGAITNQRCFLIQAPTLAFAGGSTVTNSATFATTGAPIQGTSATLTNAFDAWFMGGSVAFGNNSNVVNVVFSTPAPTSGVYGSKWSLAGTFSGSPADMFMNIYSSALAGAFTVTRLDLFHVTNPTGAATVTDMCVFSFDANAGTHKAVDAGTTKTTPTTVTQWLKANINGTIGYIPTYSSKTS